MFRKPKKPIQRRVFSGYSDEEDIENSNQIEAMETEEIETKSETRLKKSKKIPSKDKNSIQGQPVKSSLLSFDDEGMHIL